MSSYYDFYLYVKDKGKLKYCGPYHKNGKEASLFAVTGMNANDILNDSLRISLDTFQGIEGLDNFKDNQYIDTYLLKVSDVQYDKLPCEGYILKSIFRRMEIIHEKFELAEAIEEFENESVLSISEYKQLPDDVKQKYIYHCWKLEGESDCMKNRLLEAAKAWFYTHTDFEPNLNVDFNDCQFIIVQT